MKKKMFQKYPNFLKICSIFNKNLPNFAPSNLKLHNQYCHGLGRLPTLAHGCGPVSTADPKPARGRRWASQLPCSWYQTFIRESIETIKNICHSRKLCYLEQFWLIMHKNMPNMCLQRMEKRDRPSESEDKLTSILRPKKSKGDLKRYEFMVSKYYLNTWS